ncbi:hypothetical protein [Methylobacterium sp. Leaf85]|uniref:hypothetical protein n=1 Tax=Methylobacterium sp. Leaf85 TaxID=1736241 RepID=UPI0006F34136|nr:hypothetical protein [Methylobacterium sp. Leaf85]KQO52512.1 hypothetical protein ASF08_20565 [Methylobacterium sp. Leaf85]
MAHDHWENCVAHFDAQVDVFADEYFGRAEVHCLLVAAAGFDPRSIGIATLLAGHLGNRLSGLFVREERGTPDASLVTAADKNAEQLRALVPGCEIATVEIFGNDNAPVAGARIASVIRDYNIAAETTDIVLDMTALSIGVVFPAARLLLDHCESSGIAFHIMIASNPELDDAISSEPADRPMAVRGFAGTDHSDAALEISRIWVPQLAKGRTAALTDIGRSIRDTYKICPVVPFPARDPRRADALIAEYGTQLIDEWQVDPRDLVYVSESNPLDCYRTLSTLTKRYADAVDQIFVPSIILSPVGSRVMAAGALMAAIEHNLPVQYIETVRYDFDPAKPAAAAAPDMRVHLLLSGPAYSELGAASALSDVEDAPRHLGDVAA